MISKEGKVSRFYESSSAWIRSFDLSAIKCLIVCRGPVRKEAMDIFDEIGIQEYGILLSEKDSVVYPMTLAPELRGFRFKKNIHRVPDYMGAGQEEKTQRIKEIIQIAQSHHYTHLFAGYGFMAEDAEFIEAIEKSGLNFMGPSSHIAKQAGAKDQAKKIARSLNLSVTPGVDNISALALIAKVKDQEGLKKIAAKQQLTFEYDQALSLEDNAEKLLQVGYTATQELVTVEELQAAALVESKKIWEKFPKHRIRYKYIGGGGGKGQRIIKGPEEIKGAVKEILAESKVLSPGSNRNFLIELNIENTRHNEIQLIGNGNWVLALGGRDCSLQMHEQKLLELSNTKELLLQEIEKAKGSTKEAVLRGDLKVLTEMEEQSEAFGKAVGLDSVSTFESIVEGENHFFMEINTRIQVEHRVTEMAYKLKFTNPEDPKDYFYIESLVEAMALLSLHGKRLPRPERILRHLSGGEARINATNQSLQPHAGGVIHDWSPPIEYEVRDDQGIGTRDPDTNLFIHYRLAGAYDSNIALLVSYGKSRQENLERLAHILKVTVLRGEDLQTNLPVHYGLINWILGKEVMFKPNTRFMMSYLAAVGALEEIAKDVDIDLLWKHLEKKQSPESLKALQAQYTLLTRPINNILSQSHTLAGFLGRYDGKSWRFSGDKLVFLKNPVEVLKDLYVYLNLESSEDKAPCHQIWDHDLEILENALSFYQDLEKHSGIQEDYAFWEKSFAQGKNPAPKKLSKEEWEACLAAHQSFQLGQDLLKVLPNIGKASGFFELGVDEALNAKVPDKFSQPESIQRLVKLLNPPPKAKSDEIVAPMGGMFYTSEAPNQPPMIKVGDHFEAGQPLFIIEVMKMFNQISAPFSGTIVDTYLSEGDGKIITKGQAIFKVKPDEEIHEESEEEIQARKRKTTLSLIKA
ncbi:MAG: biotin carboxylase [Deltaproteobacteria bacterium]|nr:biotin carboxylase [Deltaproteobacteria bacterium]